jgi:nucleotide-binding universal stress UspA family protein
MRVLIALDGSSASKKALDFFISCPEFERSSIVLFRSAPSILNLAIESAYEKLIEQEAYIFIQNYLKEIATELESKGFLVKTVIKHGDPRLTILETAEEEKVDLIVIGTKGLTGISRVLIGCVAQYVVANSSIPVLVVPYKG